MGKNEVNLHVSRNTILSQDIRLSMNTKQTRRNLNTLVIGGSGSGKSRFFVKPNLCEMPLNTSFVITDPSGELIQETGTMLEGHGYKIKVLNLVNMDLSYHYNPLKYLREENDVVILVDTLLQNTSDPNKTGGDAFWDKAEALMLEAFTSLLWLHGKDLHLPCTMTQYLEFIRGLAVQEDNNSFFSKKESQEPCYTDKIFAAVKTEGWWFDTDGNFYSGKPDDPNSPSVAEMYDAVGDDVCTRYYDGFKQGAGKTLKSILISSEARLSKLESEGIAKLFAQDDIELEKIGDEKTALFVTLPQDHDSFDFIAAILYSQLFQTLYYHAENECKGNYLVKDSAGEVSKIVEVPHVIEHSAAIDHSKSVEVKLSAHGASEVSPKKSKKDKKKSPEKTEEELIEEQTRPDDDPGEANEKAEKLAKEYVRKFKEELHAFENNGLYILKVPDANGQCDALHGEIIGMYSDAEQAFLKQERLKACRVDRCGLYLPYHVRFLLDEFANIGKIPAFNKKLATMRKYEISCAVIIQAIDQLKALYKDDMNVLIGNCDTTLFLGSSDQATTEFINKKLGKATETVRNHSASRGGKGSSSLSYNKGARELMTTDEIALMPDSDCIVMIRGVRPYYGKKHQFTNHRNYKYTSDADINNLYTIRPPEIKRPVTSKISLHNMPKEEAAKAYKEAKGDLSQFTETTLTDDALMAEIQNILASPVPAMSNSQDGANDDKAGASTEPKIQSFDEFFNEERIASLKPYMDDMQDVLIESPVIENGNVNDGASSSYESNESSPWNSDESSSFTNL